MVKRQKQFEYLKTWSFTLENSKQINVYYYFSGVYKAKTPEKKRKMIKILYFFGVDIAKKLQKYKGFHCIIFKRVLKWKKNGVKVEKERVCKWVRTRI